MNNFLKAKSRCPDCHASFLAFEDGTCFCFSCKATFPIVEGTPVLIRHENEVFPIQAYLKNEKKVLEKPSLSELVPSPSVNLRLTDNLKKFAAVLEGFESAAVLVLGSGKQRRWLDQFFSGTKDTLLVYCDVDAQALLDLFCDGHDLPFMDNTFHGVIATAVLEHVLYPERVVSEIYRVLVPGGIVYSEIPFMQQVHEGAYDFTRYTLSGHRRLFNHFFELSSGLIAGPGTALVWAIENFSLCFTRGPLSRSFVKAGIRFIFFWIKYFDYLFKDSAQAIDAASCTYFLGRKDMQYKTSDKTIIERYGGAQHCSHLYEEVGSRT
ncbi:MAG: class I SAM-dependent methyltransferase [Ignavibacteriae bacterium]|nr:class I SAM-dependent methyltransferase [Ignavibacteriota bacterium]